MPYQCLDCGGETKCPDTERKGWRGKHTLPKIECLSKPTHLFETVEIPRKLWGLIEDKALLKILEHCRVSPSQLLA